MAVTWKTFSQGIKDPSMGFAELTPANMTRDTNPHHYFTSVVISFLQFCFHEYVPGFTWDENPQESKILITDESLPKENVKYPALVVLRAVSAYGSPFVGDLADPTSLNANKNLTPEEKRSGEVKVDIVSGTFIIGCLAKQHTEAEHLGWIVGKAIRQGSKYLRRAGFHTIGRQIQWSGVTGPQGFIQLDPPPGDLRCVQVSVPFHFTDSWQTFPAEWQEISSVAGSFRVSSGAEGEDGVMEQKMLVRGNISDPRDNKGRKLDGIWTPIT